jgi:hypothetical protein
MTAPLRRFLLNREISVEARRIAHFATKTCCRHDVFGVPRDDDNDHTKNCNALKHQIETFVINVKLAGQQRRQQRRQHQHDKGKQEFAEVSTEHS